MMTFGEKLKRRMAQLRKTDPRQARMLRGTSIAAHIADGTIPRADHAFRIATALGVSVDWLLDDSQGWPPPVSAPSNASTSQLVEELGRRMHDAGASAVEKIGQARGIDWVRTAEKLIASDHHAPLPRRLMKAVELPQAIRRLQSVLERYDPEFQQGDAESDDWSALSLCDLQFMLRELSGSPGYEATASLAWLWVMPEECRGESAVFERAAEDCRLRAAELLEADRKRLREEKQQVDPGPPGGKGGHG